MDFSRRMFLTGGAAFVAGGARADEGAGRVLEARAGQATPNGTGTTPILGFDGHYPGPLLRWRQGETLDVTLRNALDTPMTLHWHGLRGDNAMDGVAGLTQPAVAPGAQFVYRRPLPDPGLFFYRPCVFGKTPELSARGLKGLLIVDEAAPPPTDADIVLALDDWRLGPDGKIADGFGDVAEARGDGRIGTLVSVNGAPAPLRLDAPPRGRVRLRLANLANARLMALTFEGVDPFVIAIDSQPCDPFAPVRRTIPAAPGARFELMFDMPAEAGAKAHVALRGAVDQDLLVVTAAGAKAEQKGKITALPPNPQLPAVIRLDQSKKIDLAFQLRGPANAPSSWTINGAKGGYGGDPLFRVARGTPVTLGLVNTTETTLSIHVHGHCVRLLHDLDDGWEPYWRNAVVIAPGKTKHVAFIADNPGKWALRDDILEHEAGGLAGWFEVGA